MAISLDQVQHMARLAKLALSEVEAQELCFQLGEVITYIKALQEVDTKGTSPMFQPLFSQTIFRKDVVKESLTKELALQNAPEKRGDFFSVPRVIPSGSDKVG